MDIDDKVFLVLYNVILNIDNKTYNELKNLKIYNKKKEEIYNLFYILIICLVIIIVFCIILYTYYYKHKNTNKHNIK